MARTVCGPPIRPWSSRLASPACGARKRTERMIVTRVTPDGAGAAGPTS